MFGRALRDERVTPIGGIDPFLLPWSPWSCGWERSQSHGARRPSGAAAVPGGCRVPAGRAGVPVRWRRPRLPPGVLV